MRVVYVIPSYGKDELTASIVAQLLDDGVPPADVLVVDNLGTYVAPEGVVAVTPRQNLGWLVATNLGMEVGFDDPECGAVVWLNNDVEISPGFTRALTEPLVEGAWLVAPLYDGNPSRAQHKDGVDLATFEPVPVQRDVTWVEGVCVLVSRAGYEALGPLDARHFGWRGWGADVDYCLQVGRAGGRVVVTEAAFLHHEGGATARALDASYSIGAMREMSLALRRRWGRGWAERYGVPGRQPTTRLGRLRVRIEEYGGIPVRRRAIRRRLVEVERLRREGFVPSASSGGTPR